MVKRKIFAQFFGSRALSAAFVLFALTPGAVPAQTASPAPSSAPTAVPQPGPADCSLVSADEVASILGSAVGPADESSRSGGVCFFSSKSLSEEGAASYAVVGNDRIQQRRAYFAVLARRCAGVQPGASSALECKTFGELAQAKDVDAYFAARTDFPNAEPIKGLGDAAVAAGEALYVRRGDTVFEIVVRRGNALAIDRATALAKLVLARVPLSPPEPASTPRRPKTS